MLPKLPLGSFYGEIRKSQRIMKHPSIRFAIACLLVFNSQLISASLMSVQTSANYHQCYSPALVIVEVGSASQQEIIRRSGGF